MAAQLFDRTWMWHPSFTEDHLDTAGRFVHFRKTFVIADVPPASLNIHVTANTRYKLFVNCQNVAYGPVKGDQNLWFFDEIDRCIPPAWNRVAVLVLRLFYAIQYATPFARLPSGGLKISSPDIGELLGRELQSSTAWETAVDRSTTLRIDDPKDDILHVYERVARTLNDELYGNQPNSWSSRYRWATRHHGNFLHA